jgi:LacI family transcriptional regulator
MSPTEPSTRIALLLRPDSGYCRGVLRGIKRYAQQKHDWSFWMADKIVDMSKMMNKWRPSGIIAFAYLQEHYKQLKQARLPLVSIANVDTKAQFPTVCVNDYQVGRVAAHYLLKRGFCHFGFVGFPRSNYSNHRQKGFEAALAQDSHTPHIFMDPSWPQPDSVWDWTGEEKIETWLRNLPKPCGLLATNDAVALRLSDICKHINIRIPEEIALLGVDNDDLFCELAQPQLSSVQIPMEQIGYEAAWLLDQTMQGKNTPATPYFLPPMTVVTRQSTDIKLIDDAQVAEIIQYIHDNAHTPITMEDVLDRFRISRRSLERKCRTELGRTPLQELIRVRIEKSLTLLSQTALPVSRIAQQVGFASSKQFCTMFRNKMQITPTAYRQQFHKVR